MSVPALFSKALCVALLLAAHVTAGSLAGGLDWAPHDRPLFLDACLSSLQFEQNGGAWEYRDPPNSSPDQLPPLNIGLGLVSPAPPAESGMPSDPFEPVAGNPSIAVLGAIILLGALSQVYRSPAYARWYRYLFGPLDEY